LYAFMRSWGGCMGGRRSEYYVRTDTTEHMGCVDDPKRYVWDQTITTL
jgi:hypothetical protein